MTSREDESLQLRSVTGGSARRVLFSQCLRQCKPLKRIRNSVHKSHGRRASLALKALIVLASLTLVSIIPTDAGSHGYVAQVYAVSSFDSPVMVNDNKLGEQMTPSTIWIPGRGLFVVWLDTRSCYAMYSSTSVDGTNFTRNLRIDDPIFNTSMPRGAAIAASINGTILVSWDDNRRNTFDYDIFSSRSFNFGSSFSRNVKVDDSNYTSPSWQEQSSVAVTMSGAVYVAWTDDRSGTPRIRGAMSSDLGRTFSASKAMITTGTGSQNQVALVANSNRIFAAFIDNSLGVNHPFVSVSTNGGRAFSTPVRLDVTGNPGTAQMGISIAPMPNGGIVAVWEDLRNGDSDIYAVMVSADGSVMSPNIRVDNDAGIVNAWQANPSVATDQLGNVYAAWQDERTSGSPAIRFALLKAGATQFNASMIVSTPQISGGVPAMQLSPSVAAESPGQVYVTWQDDKGGTSDIYVARGNFPNLYNLAVGRGWNFISLFLDGKTYKASTLGLAKGDMIASWNSSNGVYDKRYIVGVSPASADFTLSESTGYWIYAVSAETLTLNGTVPTSKHVKSVVVPSGGYWAAVGFESLNSTRKASDIPAMFSVSKGITSVVSYNPTTNKYSNYLVGVPSTDFRIVPGQGYWCWCVTSGVLTYDS